MTLDELIAAQTSEEAREAVRTLARALDEACSDLDAARQQDLDGYQIKAARTACTTTGWTKEKLAVFGLGLAGEAGEVVELVKKHVGHGHALDRDKLTKELGDVLWYIAALCSHQGLKLADVASANIAKLEARYPQGFSNERSINREESIG